MLRTSPGAQYWSAYGFLNASSRAVWSTMCPPVWTGNAEAQRFTRTLKTQCQSCPDLKAWNTLNHHTCRAFFTKILHRHSCLTAWYQHHSAWGQGPFSAASEITLTPVYVWSIYKQGDSGYWFLSDWDHKLSQFHLMLHHLDQEIPVSYKGLQMHLY